MDRIGSRVQRIDSWGYPGSSPSYFSLANKINNDHIIAIGNGTPSFGQVTDYNIRTKTFANYGTLASSCANSVIASNGHIICIPYNSVVGWDIDPVAQTIHTFNNGVSNFPGGGAYTGGNEKLLSNGDVLGIPRAVAYCLLYHPSTQTVEQFGNLTNAQNSSKMTWQSIKINDNLFVLTPASYNAFVNIDPINKTTEEYGSIDTTNVKFRIAIKVNDNNIIYIPSSYAQCVSVDPINKTVTAFGPSIGVSTTTYLYETAIQLSSGKILALPSKGTLALLIDPINLTVETFGSFLNTKYNFSANYIELSNGHVIAIPSDYRYIVDVDPINKQITDIADLGTSINKFVTDALAPAAITKISDNQILASPFAYTSFIDFNPITGKLNKLAYVPGTGTDKFIRTGPIFDGSKRLIYINYNSSKLIDITLR